MISIELPWEADKAIQQLGRVHRSNQRVPPKFAFVVTDLGGEVRFVSAVARRLRILGAMMRGDRNSAHGAVESLASYDLQNRYGRKALARFMELIRSGAQPEVSFSFLAPNRRGRQAGRANTWQSWEDFRKAAEKALDMIGIRPDTDDKFEETLSESKTLNVFLNRLLMLEPGIQNALFDAVAELYGNFVGVDRADGSFDEGQETLNRQRGVQTEVSLVHKEVLFKDPSTGAETAYARLRLDKGMSWKTAVEALERRPDVPGSDAEGFYWCQRRDGTALVRKEVVLAMARPLFRGSRAGVTYDEDEDDDPEYDLHGPHGLPQQFSSGRSVDKDTLSKGLVFRRAAPAELPQVERVWRATHSASEAASSRWSEEHILTGSILSTWAVLGAAVGGGSSSLQARVTKIPLVRARLVDGGAVVGVRVRPERLDEVRYVMATLREARSTASEGSGSSDIQRLSVQLEAFLRTQPNQSATWHGWVGAHKVLVADDLVSESTAGMQAAQEAMDDLQRNGKVDVDSSSGIVQLRDKPKGCGWYIPPPKKPKTGRGRGRRGGRGS